MTESQELLECEWCGATFERASTKGPPPKYCCRSHRQRAYEAKRFVDVASISNAVMDASKLDVASLSNAVMDASKLGLTSLSKGIADTPKFGLTSLSKGIADTPKFGLTSLSKGIADTPKLGLTSLSKGIADTPKLGLTSLSKGIADTSKLDFASIANAAANLLRQSRSMTFGGIDPGIFSRVADSASLPIVKSFDALTFAGIDLQRLNRSLRAEHFDFSGFAESLGSLVEWSDVGALHSSQIARSFLDDLRASSHIGPAVQTIADATQQELEESGTERNDSDLLVLSIVGAFLWALISAYVITPAEQAEMAAFVATVGWKILESHTFDVLVTIGNAAMLLTEMSRRTGSRTDHSSSPSGGE